jgi:hypothetical protein
MVHHQKLWMAFVKVYYVNKLIGVKAARLIGDQRLIGRPQEALLCAKAKWQQQQSAQSERKSTTRFADDSNLLK